MRPLAASAVGGVNAGAIFRTRAAIVREEGVVALTHFSTEANLIAMLNEGWLRPRSQHGRSYLGGKGDVSYFSATGPMAIKPDADEWVRQPLGNYLKRLPDGTVVARAAPDPKSVLMLFDLPLFDRTDWFWNPGLQKGDRAKNAVTPDDEAGLRRRCHDVVTRSGDWCGEICFSGPIPTRACLCIFVQDEAQRTRILRGLRAAAPPALGRWASIIRVADPFFDRTVFAGLVRQSVVR